MSLLSITTVPSTIENKAYALAQEMKVLISLVKQPPSIVQASTPKETFEHPFL